MPAHLPVRMGSVDGHIFHHLPLDENTVFVMIPGEYERVLESRKFTDIHLERTLYYPNGEPGFYFVRLNYVEDIDNILATEKEERQQLQQGEVVIDGQVVPAPPYSRRRPRVPNQPATATLAPWVPERWRCSVGPRLTAPRTSRTGASGCSS